MGQVLHGCATTTEAIRRTMLHRRRLLKISMFGTLGSMMKLPLAQAQSEAKARTRIVFLGTSAALASRWVGPIQPI